ncbi:MAG: hypothetical protein J0H17_09340 [Rhizobiales bacterium]|nr:hypothetical protein [Hyphomicrobiales bacterium]
MNNPAEANLKRWRRALDGAAATLADLDVSVLNESPVSTLTAYPTVDFRKALAC